MSDVEELLAGDTEFYVVSDDDQPDTPTDLYGVWLAVGVFVGIIIFSFFLVGGIMCCSRAQERAKREGRQARKEDLHASLKSNLTCKPWAPKDTMLSSATSGGTTCSDTSSEPSTNGPDDEASAGSPKAHIVCLQQKDGSACAICNKEYEPGQPVYHSNNPQCGHVCHAACMDKWLQFQNTCPTCNQPFAIRPGVESV